MSVLHLDFNLIIIRAVESKGPLIILNTNKLGNKWEPSIKSRSIK